MTDELSQKLARARAHIDPGFPMAGVEQALLGLTRRIERRRKAKRALALGSAVLLLALGAVALRSPAVLQLAERERTVRTQDGSSASLLEADTELQVQHDGENEVALSLTRGAGHFDVTPRPKRRYRVHAGAVDVQVLGTVFDVTRRGARTQVSVTRGAVQVSWPAGLTVLHAGDSQWFPPVPSAAVAPSVEPHDEPSPALEPVAAPALESAPAVSSAPARHDAWRALERAGKHREAFRSLDRVRGPQVEDLEGLLLAADAARLSRHPRQAAKYLERLVDKYPESAPARLGAFTLGGLQLQELHDPRQAARSFARAYELDPGGPLAEDALAREAEAEARAGLHERAASTAERYLARYPRGARRAELARYLAGSQ